MCDFLKVTPRELGEKRRKDPIGVSFLERFMIYKWQKENEARKKIDSKAKRGKSIRRK